MELTSLIFADANDISIKYVVDVIGSIDTLVMTEASQSAGDSVLALIDNDRSSVRARPYRHFKGNRYFVVGEAYADEETLYVLYVREIDGTAWARSLEDFTSMKTFEDGTSVRRFAPEDVE